LRKICCLLEFVLLGRFISAAFCMGVISCLH
jgi:hypothetical protein